MLMVSGLSQKSHWLYLATAISNVGSPLPAPRDDEYSPVAGVVYTKPVATPYVEQVSPDMQKIMQENVMLKQQNSTLEQTVTSMQAQINRLEEMMKVLIAQTGKIGTPLALQCQ